MTGANEGLATEPAAELYEGFLAAREAAVIVAIREVCGISDEAAKRLFDDEDGIADELAADVSSEEAEGLDDLDDLLDRSGAIVA